MKYSSIVERLNAPIDNIQLILFRILFGALLAWHCIDAMMTTWLDFVFIQPKFTFSHIGMEWLQPLAGNGMYYYYAVMAVCGVLVSIGLFYRYSLGVFTILFAGAYYMQKTTYNNHHYLMLLLCVIMLFLPANTSYAVDVKLNRSKRQDLMPAWCRFVLIFQISIVYFFATVAKLYPDWLDGTFIRILLSRFKMPILKEIFSYDWFIYSVTYGGLFFDFLIIPLLLYRKTRKYAFFAAIFFHMFNKALLAIGVFPFLALAFSVLFFPPEFFRKYFHKSNSVFQSMIPDSRNSKKILILFFLPFFILQLALPLRHWFIKGDVLWTEEGHRLSWRMMLRSRVGETKFLIVNNATNSKEFYDLDTLLTKSQIKQMRTMPDMIWQTAQIIKEQYNRKGIEISIYVDSKVSINNKPKLPLIDPNVDLAKAKWDYFAHNEWILLYD
ncbi:HTTM domain-containing protein [Flavobacterium ardleyense]|uniref:HTTM domain-containing protein n=1 Tax=Flavobacterium ardleyense TaxID=2038737 RepID=UPI00298C3EB8|nr:HTTM domain-containing protein [Flavobacterium ardleyense]